MYRFLGLEVIFFVYNYCTNIYFGWLAICDANLPLRLFYGSHFSNFFCSHHWTGTRKYKSKRCFYNVYFFQSEMGMYPRRYHPEFATSFIDHFSWGKMSIHSIHKSTKRPSFPLLSFSSFRNIITSVSRSLLYWETCDKAMM